MFDYRNPTDYNRSDDELLRFWLFALLVSNKRADVTAKKLAQFEEALSILDFPTATDGDIHKALQAAATGQYNRLGKSMRKTRDAIAADPSFLRDASVRALEEITGPKTVRFFIAHSRADARVAVLDTHVLSWMREQELTEFTGFPSRAQYRDLEGIFLGEADKRGVTPAMLDIEIWRERALSA